MSNNGSERWIARATRDVRALGSSAPLRAAYELSKRCGGHRILFREVNSPLFPSTPLPIGGVTPVSEAARTRCLEDAHAIVNDGTRVFGSRPPTGIKASWCTDPLTGEEWPSDLRWWEIDIRSDHRLSDVKFVWESGRHRDLVVLARANKIDAHGEWLTQLDEALNRWFIECPPERGVHWYSSLELALRAIAWSQVITLAGDDLPALTRVRMERQLIASARHLMLELPYTVSSMKNNHLIGDGLGLVVLGHMFPTHPSARRWRRMGDWLMTRQLKRHMLSDGSMIEDSLSYHRFVMEMLMVRQLLGDAPYEIQQALQSSALHLVDLGVLNGPVPQYGDWDEGRVLADSGIAGSTVGSLLLALHLVGFEVPRASWPSHDELSWYSAPQYGLKPIPAPTSGSIRAGYFVRCSTDTYTTWLKVSGGPSHQHADLSALWIQHNGEWITEDPGTGTYNGPLEVRNGFRTSIAHNVWCPANEDQLQPHRAFRWLRSAKGICSNPLVISDRHFVLMVHDAYLHANQHLRVARLVVTSPTGVTVFDAADRSVDTEWTMSIPLGQGITKDHFFGIEDAYEVTGSTHPFLGWHSPTYGSWVQSRWLRVHRSTIQTTTWGVGDLDENVFDICFKWETNQVTVNFKTDNGTHEIELSYV